ncbi:hypothetical protein K501DRAFT_327890 [Backusella circina FSU 941]|nr:hypothetical protein K501DRAFT_327890 [Backusella circina FSU 941]
MEHDNLPFAELIMKPSTIALSAVFYDENNTGYAWLVYGIKYSSSTQPLIVIIVSIPQFDLTLSSYCCLLNDNSLQFIESLFTFRTSVESLSFKIKEHFLYPVEEPGQYGFVIPDGKHDSVHKQECQDQNSFGDNSGLYKVLLYFIDFIKHHLNPISKVKCITPTYVLL